MSAKYTFLAWDTPVKDASTKLALLQLANNADDNGFSYYSISKMAKACDMSERNFMRKIQTLEEMKILTVERRANRPSLYTLIGDEMGVTDCHLHGSEVTDCHAMVTICHPDGDRLSHDPKSSPINNPKSVNHTKKAPAKKKTKFPADFKITEQMFNWFLEKEFDIDIEQATEKWVLGMQAGGYSYIDWSKAWMNGMIKAQEWSK